MKQTIMQCPHCEDWQVEYTDEALLEGFTPSFATQLLSRNDLSKWSQARAEEATAWAKKNLDGVLEAHLEECPGAGQPVPQCPEGCGPAARGACPHPVLGEEYVVISRQAWDQLCADFTRLAAENADLDEKLNQARRQNVQLGLVNRLGRDVQKVQRVFKTGDGF